LSKSNRCPYIKYYCALEFLDANNNNIDDNIKDYDNIINISEINEEGKKKRILKNAGIIKEYTNFFTEPSYIIDNIYLGSAFNAASYETLIKYNIKIIISTKNSPYSRSCNCSNVPYCTVPCGCISI